MKPKPAARKMISQNVFQVSILDMHLERKRNLVIKIIGARKTNKPIKNGQETCIDTSPRRIYRGPIDMKKCLTSLITRERQVKTSMRYHLHLSEWLPSINQQTSAREDVEKRIPSALLVGMQSGVATVENNMEYP